MAQQLYSQEDGVVAFNIPARNSLRFNRPFINPTFSFVRQQNKYVSFNNKREWVQFNNAPQTYLLSYSGRFQENIGAGVSLFQQKYGVLTTFGGVLNFAYNAILDRYNNLTFGINLGFYKSGINEGSVVTNSSNNSDPSLNNFPSNSIITINPGINYGTEFLDFGVSIKNLVSYNFISSKLIEENPEQGIQGHVMYTGYLNSRSFFDESRFTTLISSEFKKEETIVSAMFMLMVPKGVWAQAGYNSLYALSAGIGLNISSQVAIEYNYEKGVGGFSNFGNSHDITLAYKFKNNERYDYNGDDEEKALIISSKMKRRNVTKRRHSSKTQTPRKPKPVEIKKNNDNTDKLVKTKAQKDQASIAKAVRIKAEAQAKAKREADAKAKVAEAAQASIAEAARIKAEAEAKAKREADAKIKALQKEQAKLAENKKNTAQKEVQISEIVLDEVLIAFKKSIELSKNIQQDLLDKLNKKVTGKQQDLDDLKKENDLSEKGITSAPKTFKSISAENAEIESLKLKIDNSIEIGKAKITEIQNLHKKRSNKNKNDAISKTYINTIQTLKSEQQQAENIKQNLISKLSDIKIATDFERRRRIKRAAYDNDDDRYNNDKKTLERLKQSTSPSLEILTKEDFDYGEELNNIQIVKGVNNTKNGYYLVVAVHNSVTKRDEFLKKAIAAGENDINFFFDVNTNKYYIYCDKFDDISKAKSKLDANKGNKPFNSKMNIVKIKN